MAYEGMNSRNLESLFSDSISDIDSDLDSKSDPLYYNEC